MLAVVSWCRNSMPETSPRSMSKMTKRLVEIAVCCEGRRRRKRQTGVASRQQSRYAYVINNEHKPGKGIPLSLGPSLTAGCIAASDQLPNSRCFIPALTCHASGQKKRGTQRIRRTRDCRVPSPFDADQSRHKKWRMALPSSLRQAEETEQMFHRVFVMFFATVLVGAILGRAPANNSGGQLCAGANSS